jgi:hypothetical protein
MMWECFCKGLHMVIEADCKESARRKAALLWGMGRCDWLVSVCLYRGEKANAV